VAAPRPEGIKKAENLLVTEWYTDCSVICKHQNVCEIAYGRYEGVSLSVYRGAIKLVLSRHYSPATSICGSVGKENAHAFPHREQEVSDSAGGRNCVQRETAGYLRINMARDCCSDFVKLDIRNLDLSWSRSVIQSSRPFVKISDE
jgi:hypothetical protein